MSSADLLSLIEKKKAHVPLTESEIRGWMSDLVAERVPIYQSAALLMAIRLNGMDFDETLALTRAMTDSGDRMTFPGYELVADKHSTGGVGDKVTLILAPLVAACGLPVTMLSGRSLGHTGGTIDKFEALKGVSCGLDEQGMRDMLDKIGWTNAQSSERIAPADRILYALRDVTGTVDSIPLITASILSKKIAGGASHLCLDVKCGSGAFMVDEELARALAENLVKIGEMGGMSVRGWITRMEEPLGHTVGNYLELLESVAYLKSLHETPLMNLVLALGGTMLKQGGLVTDRLDGEAMMRERVTDGSGLQKLVDYLEHTGGEASALSALLADDLNQHQGKEVRADRDGYVTAIHGRALGTFGIRLGAGRRRQSDKLDHEAGFVLEKHCGDEVRKGDVLFRVCGQAADTEVEPAMDELRSYYTLSDEAPDAPTLLIHEL